MARRRAFVHRRRAAQVERARLQKNSDADVAL
jgi:hypothetical protein